MKKIINGKRYDTETAREVGRYTNTGNQSDFNWYSERLYCKRTGEYFLYGRGGPMTRWSHQEDQNTTSGGSGIEPMTESEAREWAERSLDADEYEAEFPVVPDDDLPLTGSAIRAAREAVNMTQRQLADKMGVDQARISDWEKGQDMTVSSLVKLAAALGVDPGELLK